MPRQNKLEKLDPLHLVRLANSSVGVWLPLPDSALKIISLKNKLTDQAHAGWIICITGEVIIDLPNSNFVCLRSGEGFLVSGMWSAVPIHRETVLLM